MRMLKINALFLFEILTFSIDFYWRFFFALDFYLIIIHLKIFKDNALSLEVIIALSKKKKQTCKI